MDEQKDRWLTCIDCGNDFVFESGEQEYYKEKGLFSPKRCPSCRKKRKENYKRDK